MSSLSDKKRGMSRRMRKSEEHRAAMDREAGKVSAEHTKREDASKVRAMRERLAPALDRMREKRATAMDRKSYDLKASKPRC